MAPGTTSTVGRRTLVMAMAAVAMTVAACSSTTSDAGGGAVSDGALPPATQSPSGPVMEGMCAEGEPDCDDMVQAPVSELPDGGAAGACPVDNPDCGDNPAVDDPPTGPEVAPLVATPMTGLLDVAPTPWDSVEFDQDQTVATVTWLGGNPECEGLDRVEVDLSEEAITLTVFTGRVPGDTACTLQLVPRAADVELGEPLGPRSVLDGAA